MTAGPNAMRRSVPWSDSEKIRVNDMALTYVVSTGVIYVRMPGGKTMAATTLQALGYKVELPRVMRNQDFF